MKKAFTIIIFVLAIAFNVKGQSWEWLTKINSATSWLGGVTSLNNNLYSAPYSYTDTLYLPGSTIPVPPRTSCLIKTNSNGNIDWVKQLGKLEVRQLSHDQQNILLTGVFYDTLLVNNITMISSGSADIFIASFDTLGNLNWINQTGGKCYDIPFDIEGDNSGNVFTVAKLPSGCGQNYDPSGKFIFSKYNSVGQLFWNKILDSTIWFPTVHIGSDNSIYLTAMFHDSLQISDSVTSYKYYQKQGSFLLKLGSNLNINWIHLFNTDDYVVISKVVTDNSQNIYVPVGSPTSFTCGPNTFNRTAIIKYQANGYLSQYLYPLGSLPIGTPKIKWMADNTLGIIANTKYSNQIIKTDIFLNAIKTASISFAHDWGPHDVFFDTDNNGDFLIGGNTSDSLNFSGSSQKLPMLNFYQQQTYYTKLGNSTAIGVHTYFMEKVSSFIAYPNPSSGIFSISGYDKNISKKICVYDVYGKCLLKKDAQNNSEVKVDLEDHPKGIYFLELTSGDQRTVKKIVIQ